MRYLFCFGYETPDQYENNRQNGYDEEDSSAVWVEAKTKDEAMSAGLRFARSFIERLFAEKGQPLPFEWSESTYASWIVDDPYDEWSPEYLDGLETIQS
jgi:hypothetical protein